MNTVAIAGVGLIGASFGLALREAGFTGDIIGVSSQAALDAGLKSGAINSSAGLAEAAARADVIYLAQPVNRILQTIEELAHLARPGTLITDAGSTKQKIVQKATTCLPPAQFLGGHPMAGKEQRGAAAAQADLFRDRPYILTPEGELSQRAATFKMWLTRIGARVTEMSAEIHDKTVAFTSHLPQLASTALAVTLAREQNEQLLSAFGPGLLDMTRLALSSADLWNPILETNKSEVLLALKRFREIVEDLQLSLEGDSLVELFAVGSGWATQLRRQGTKNSPK
jgi:prephenate dehydrogenase